LSSHSMSIEGLHQRILLDLPKTIDELESRWSTLMDSIRIIGKMSDDHEDDSKILSMIRRGYEHGLRWQQLEGLTFSELLEHVDMAIQLSVLENVMDSSARTRATVIERMKQLGKKQNLIIKEGTMKETEFPGCKITSLTSKISRRIPQEIHERVIKDIAR